MCAFTFFTFPSLPLHLHKYLDIFHKNSFIGSFFTSSVDAIVAPSFNGVRIKNLLQIFALIFTQVLQLNHFQKEVNWQLFVLLPFRPILLTDCEFLHIQSLHRLDYISQSTKIMRRSHIPCSSFDWFSWRTRFFTRTGHIKDLA